MAGLVRYRVVEPHRAEPGPPLCAAAGDILRIERRPTEWPGWVWGVADSGTAAWVPEAWLAVDEDEAELKRDYDSEELAVDPGETLWVELVESGWALATRTVGGRGWVPLAKLQAL